MKTVALHKYKVVPPKNSSAFAIETDKDEIKLHTLMAIVAKRGGGKSQICCQKIRDLKAAGHVDRVFVISPTLHSNKDLIESMGVDIEDCFDTPSNDSIIEIKHRIEQEGWEWEEYQRKLKEYHRLMKLLKSNNTLSSLDPELLLRALNDDFFEEPKSKYDGKYPKMFLVVDDCLGSALFSPRSTFVNFCMTHRHIGSIGVSVIILAQVYCANGGIPRPVRENVTHLLIGKSKDSKTIEKIADEVAGDVNIADFLQAFSYATQDPYSFLMIDFAQKSPAHRFRKNFEELIVFEDHKEST